MAEKKNAMQVAYRASMLPIGNYEDGSIAFPVVPQGAVDAWEAFKRFHAGEAPQPQDAVLAGLAMAGTGFGGLGRAVSGKALQRAEASSGLPSHSVGAGRFDFTPGAPRSAEVGQSSLSYLPEDGIVELTALGTPQAYRGQGAATQAMQRFTGALDEAGLPSRLVARGDTGTDPARLQQFYASHGYEAPGPDGYMVRPPKTLFSNAPDAAPTGMLAMDAASRMERAKAMGFDTNQRYYHLTPNDVDEFKLNADPSSHTGGGAIWAREDPRTVPAAHQVYEGGAFKDGANDMPLLIKEGNRLPGDVKWQLQREGKLSSSFPYVVTMEENQLLRSMGYDYAHNGNEVAVFNPAHIRSPNAAFDPAKSDSANLLASNAPDAAPVGALAMDAASRMERARAMGFDTDKTWYHGSPTGRQISEFDLSAPKRTDNGYLGSGVYVTPKEWIAKSYANPIKGHSPNSDVLPLHVKEGQFKEFDYVSQEGYQGAIADFARELGVEHPYLSPEWGEAFRKAMIERGYVGSRGMGGDGTVVEMAVYDPKAVRRTNAAFDPSKSDSANLLAANPPSAAGILATQGQAMPGQSPFDAALAQLQGILVDLDGDGQPDAQIPRKMIPQGQPNAMAPGFDMLPAQAPQPNAMAPQALTGPEAAAEAGMAHIRQNAGTPMGPVPPAPNALQRGARFIGNAIDEVVSDPLHALQGLDAFGGLAGPTSAARTVANPGSREMIRREMRSTTEVGMRKNLMDDIQSSQRYSQEAAAARAADPDVVLSRAPTHELLERGPDGRFQALSEDVKAARQRGMEKRAREQRAAERAKYLNEGSN
jgi:hypothetical protein